MAIRLVVTITAVPGKGSELAQAYRTRCAEVMKEPGCKQGSEREDYEYTRSR